MIETKFFWGKPIKENQVVCFMGPSGTGKTFSAEFLQKYFGYKIVNQITTRKPRPDDKYYEYMDEKQFVILLESGKIVGYFDGDCKNFVGTGYGYLKENVFNELQKHKKIILFPSPYELLEKDFFKNFEGAKLFGLAFKNIKSVKDRAILAKKEFLPQNLLQRQKQAQVLIDIMEKYSKQNDMIKIIYSDCLGDDILKSKKSQLLKILNMLGDDFDDQKQIEKYINGKIV